MPTGSTGEWPSGKAPDSGSGDRRFESFLASQLLAEPQDVVVGTNEGPISFEHVPAPSQEATMYGHLTPLIFGHLILATPIRWAPDSDGHLTLGRAVDLFLAAKAAEGIAAKTLDWYGMILPSGRCADWARIARSSSSPGPSCGPGSSNSSRRFADQRRRLRPDAQGLRQLAGGRGARPGRGAADAPQAACPRQARRADQRRYDAAAPRARRRPRPGDDGRPATTMGPGQTSVTR